MLILFACSSLAQAQDNQDQNVLNSAGTQTIAFETSEGTGLSFDISPDGKFIVFDLLGQLWKIPAAGGNAVPLTDAVADTAEDLDPSFSPDGQWIAFWSDRPAGQGLYLMPAGGGIPELLPNTETGPRALPFPAWSPTGGRIAFIRNNELHLHHADLDTTVHVELIDIPGGQLQHPGWLPDGRLLLRVSQTARWMAPEGLIWLVDPETGEGEEIGTGELKATAPALSPDGTRIAYYALDDAGSMQLWVQSVDKGTPYQLTHKEELISTRARWSPDGEKIYYIAAGRLWAVNSEGGDPHSIPFTAHVRFNRHTTDLPAVRFPEPGEEMLARGHMGLALSPDGERIAKLALGKLWIWDIGGDPKAVTEVPAMAQWPAWSPDGGEVAWSAGRFGQEDLYTTSIETGETRRLTDLPGRVERPAWSPDGEQIAFSYRPGLLIPPWEAAGDERRGRFAVIPATENVITDPSNITELPEHHNLRLYGFYVAGQERPVWSPDSDALLVPAEEYEAQILHFKEGSKPLNIEGYPAFLNWSDSGIVYVKGNQLWYAEFLNGEIEDPVLLTDEPALYPSVARDGTVLYVSPEGYRLLKPDGSKFTIGWPLTYNVPEADMPVLLQNVRVINGTGAAPSAAQDILIENGRISRIGETGSIPSVPDMQLIDTQGRTVIPGLINLHQHGFDEDDIVYAASLYFGVTTIREMGGPIARNAALGEAAQAGVLSGPRLILGGFQVYPGMGEGVTGSGYQRPQTNEEGDRALAVAMAFGASYVKMRLPGNWKAGADLVQLALKRGMRVGGHCAHPLPLIAAGIHQQEHYGACGERSFSPDPRYDMRQLYKEAGVDFIPTLVTFRAGWDRIEYGMELLNDPEISTFITPILRLWGAYDLPGDDEPHAIADNPLVNRARSHTMQMHQTGIPVGTGTDNPTMPGIIHFELEELVAAGLSPLEAIRAATYTSASILGAEEEIGTIEVGKRADLILLDDDPVEDIRNTRKIYKIIKNGHVVDRDAILQWAQENNQY